MQEAMQTVTLASWLASSILITATNAWVHRQCGVLSPRQRQRLYRRLAPLTIWLACTTAWQFRLFGRPLAAGFCLAAACGVLAWVLAGGEPIYSGRKALRNYQLDRRHCGCCNYDLTGISRRICPECGWRLPDHATLRRLDL